MAAHKLNQSLSGEGWTEGGWQRDNPVALTEGIIKITAG